MKTITDLFIAQKLISIYQSAVKRRINFNLSFKKVKYLLEQEHCYYTGNKFTAEGENIMTFDRVDNNLGYIDSNVVAATGRINHRKDNLTISEIGQIYQGIQQNKTLLLNNEFPGEVWKRINNFPNYRISNYGRFLNEKDLLLKIFNNKYISLRNGKIKKTLNVKVFYDEYFNGNIKKIKVKETVIDSKNTMSIVSNEDKQEKLIAEFYNKQVNVIADKHRKYVVTNTIDKKIYIAHAIIDGIVDITTKARLRKSDCHDLGVLNVKYRVAK